MRYRALLNLHRGRSPPRKRGVLFNSVLTSARLVLYHKGTKGNYKMTLDTTTKKVEVKAPQPTGVVKEVVNKQTKDLYLAAAFHAEGCRFVSIDKTDPTRMVFVFEGGDNPDRVEREWYQKTLVVSATEYAASLRLCKSMIHSM